MNGKKSGGISRREFARRAALASAAATVAPALAGRPAIAGATAATDALASGAADAATDATTVPAARRDGVAIPPAPAQQPGNAPKLSAEGQTEAEARYQAILNQYGKRFSDEQKTDLRRLCYVAQPPLDRLRAYALANGDSAALYLKPLVERDKNPFEGTRKGKTPSAGQKQGADAFHAH